MIAWAHITLVNFKSPASAKFWLEINHNSEPPAGWSAVDVGHPDEPHKERIDVTMVTAKGVRHRLTVYTNNKKNNGT